MTTETHAVTACCATLYSHPLATLLLGESFHPGGLALTDRLIAQAGMRAPDSVLDAGSGRGVSSVHIAEAIGCQVTGLTIEASGVLAGNDLARSRGVSEKTRFVRGDIMAITSELGTFDAVLMECVLSTLPHKPGGLANLRGVLRDGGTLAISDVTMDGAIPPELEGVTASALCLAGALPLQAYIDALETGGFTVEAAQGVPEVADAFLERANRGLLLAEIAAGLGKVAIQRETLEAARRAFRSAKQLAADGQLGYATIVAKKR